MLKNPSFFLLDYSDEYKLLQARLFPFPATVQHTSLTMFSNPFLRFHLPLFLLFNLAYLCLT